MNRDYYFVISNEYREMRGRFEKSPSITLLWTGILGFLFISFYFVVKDETTYADVKMFPVLNIMAVIMLISLISTIILYVLLKQKKPCEFCLSWYTFIQTIGTLFFIESLFYIIFVIEQLDLGIMINVVSMVFVIMFMIICSVLIMRKVKNGEYQQNAMIKPIMKRVYFWGVLAIPLIPFTSITVRRYGFNSLSDIWKSILINYMILWIWLVIIYSFLARNLIFILLEIRNRTKNRF